MQGLTVGPDAWTLSQAVQALTILAHFHALCTLERAEDSYTFGSKENFYGKENNVFGKENNAPRVPINPSPSSLLMVQVCKRSKYFVKVPKFSAFNDCSSTRTSAGLRKDFQ